MIGKFRYADLETTSTRVITGVADSNRGPASTFVAFGSPWARRAGQPRHVVGIDGHLWHEKQVRAASHRLADDDVKAIWSVKYSYVVAVGIASMLDCGVGPRLEDWGYGNDWGTADLAARVARAARRCYLS